MKLKRVHLTKGSEGLTSAPLAADVKLPHVVGSNFTNQIQPGNIGGTSQYLTADLRLPHLATDQGSGNMMQMLMGKRMEEVGNSSANPDLRVILYQTLEYRRANKLRVKPLNFDVTRSKRADTLSGRISLPPISNSPRPSLTQVVSVDSGAAALSRSNSIAPFATMTPKATCGFYFNRDTQNRKFRTGVPPSDLAKWRSDYAQFPQKQG